MRKVLIALTLITAASKAQATPDLSCTAVENQEFTYTTYVPGEKPDKQVSTHHDEYQTTFAFGGIWFIVRGPYIDLHGTYKENPSSIRAQYTLPELLQYYGIDNIKNASIQKNLVQFKQDKLNPASWTGKAVLDVRTSTVVLKNVRVTLKNKLITTYNCSQI